MGPSPPDAAPWLRVVVAAGRGRGVVMVTAGRGATDGGREEVVIGGAAAAAAAAACG